jgi:hypothetical protein
MGWRPGKPVAPGCLQGEGLLAVSSPEAGTVVWLSPKAATIRLVAHDATLDVSADGAVEEPAWSSWSAYFTRVTEDDVVENALAAAGLGPDRRRAGGRRLRALRRRLARLVVRVRLAAPPGGAPCWTPGSGPASGRRRSWSASAAPSPPRIPTGSSAAPTRGATGSSACASSTSRIPTRPRTSGTCSVRCGSGASASTSSTSCTPARWTGAAAGSAPGSERTGRACG